MLQPKPKFDPNKPFDEVKDEKPKFNPNLPFSEVKKKEQTESASTSQKENTELEISDGSLDSTPRQERKNKPSVLDRNTIQKDNTSTKQPSKLPSNASSDKEIFTDDEFSNLLDSTKQEQIDLAEQRKANILEKQEQFKSHVQHTEADEIEVQDRLKGEKEVGFWDGVKDGAMTSVKRLMGIPKSDAKTTTVPFEAEIKEIKQQALRENTNLTDKEVKQYAEERFVQKQKDFIFVDKANDYLEDLDPKTKGELANLTSKTVDNLNDNHKKIVKVNTALNVVLNEDLKRLQELKNTIPAIPRLTTQEESDAHNEKIKQYNELRQNLIENTKLINRNQDILINNQEDLQTAEQEYDLLKRTYGLTFINNMALTTSDLVLGGADFINYLNNVRNELSPFTEKNERLIKSMGFDPKAIIPTKEAREQNKNERENVLRKPVESVESVNGFANYMSDLVANQLPILALTSTGYGGLAAIGATSTGQKYAEMNDEVLEGKATYKPWQMMSVPLGYGTAEAIFELPTLSILKKGKRVLNAAIKESPSLIRKSSLDQAKSMGSDFMREIGSEQATNLFQNAFDIYGLGKEGSITDNAMDVLKDSAALTLLLQGAPHIASRALQPFQAKDEIKVLEENAAEMLSLTKKLENSELTETENTVIQGKIDDLNKVSSDIMAKTIGDVSKMPEELHTKIVNINKEAGQLRAQAQDIYLNGKSKDKNELLKIVNDKHKALQEKRIELLNTELKPDAKSKETAKEETKSKVETTTPETKVEQEVVEPNEIKLNEKQEEGTIVANEDVSTRIKPSEQQGQSNSVQSIVEPRASESKAEVKETVKRVNPKGVKGEFDVSFDAKGNVTKVVNTKGKEVSKFREVIDKKTKKKRLERNANYSTIYAEATGTKTDNQIKQEKKQKLTDALDKSNPTDAFGHALDYLARGNRIDPTDAKKQTGLSDKEVKWATFSNKKGALPGIEKAAESIVENAPQNLDMQDVVNALIDLISSNTSVKDLQQTVINQVDAIENEQQEQELYAYKNSLNSEDLAKFEALKAEEDYFSELNDNEIIEYLENQYGQQETKNDTNGTPEATSVQERTGTQKSEPKTKSERKQIAKAKVGDINKVVKDFEDIFGISIDINKAEGPSKRRQLYPESDTEFVLRYLNSPDNKKHKAHRIINESETTLDLLNNLIKESKDPFLKNHLENLLPYFKANPEIKFDGMFTLGVGEAFYTGDFTVLPNKTDNFNDFVKVFAHEAYHVITLNELSNNKVFNKKITKLRQDLASSLGINIKELENTKSEDFFSKFDIIDYGLKSNEEFVAELFSNQKFVERLNNAKIGNKSFLNKIIELVKSIFKSKKSNSENIQKLILSNIDNKIKFDNSELTKKVVNNIKNGYNVNDFYINVPDSFKRNLFPDNNSAEITKLLVNIAKQAISKGIDPEIAIKEVVKYAKEKLDLDIDLATIKDRLNPKKTKAPKTDSKIKGSQFEKLANDMPNTGEVKDYLSGETTEKYTGETPQNDQNYLTIKLTEALMHGVNIIEEAKALFGKDYVSKTLAYLDDSAISTEKKALIYVSLVNQLNKDKLLYPDNKLTIQKQLDLVNTKRQAFANTVSIAMNMWRLQKFSEIGYNSEEITNKLFSPKERAVKKAIEKAMQSNMDDINAEAENQEQGIEDDFEVAPPKRKRSNTVLKRELGDVWKAMKRDIKRATNDGTLSISVPYAKQVIAATPHILKATKILAEMGFNKGSDIVNEIYRNIKEAFPALKKKDIAKVIKDNQPKKGTKKPKKKTYLDVLKQELVEAGYSREITVTVKVENNDGRTEKVKEKRTILDWKKLAGEEGSIDNMKRIVSENLKGKDYSDKQVDDFIKQLEEEFHDLRASIIEKSINELEYRNRPKGIVDRKTDTRRLAELYNYGLYEEGTDAYDNITNSLMGLNGFDQKTFNALKEKSKSMSDLYNSGFYESSVQIAIDEIHADVARILNEYHFKNGNLGVKASMLFAAWSDLSTRMILHSVGQIVQNIYSGIMQRVIQKVSNINDGTGNKDLSLQRSKVAWAVFRDIISNSGNIYGDSQSDFTRRSDIENKLNSVSKNKAYQTLLTGFLGRMHLEAPDSFNKVLITKKKFEQNLIKVLTSESNPNGAMSKKEAVRFVTESLTNQSFEDAMIKARALIEKVNKKSGKKTLRDNETAVIRLADGIVKEALLKGSKMTQDQVEASYNAAYKSAGFDLGHEANNWMTKTIQLYGNKLGRDLKQAIKEKDQTRIAILTFTNTIYRNMLTTFIGGGTNWVVLTLQGAGLPLKDFTKKGNNKLDLTTKEGVKKLENSLLRNANNRSVNARMLVGGVAQIAIWIAAVSTGADDDINDYLKKNKDAKKYFGYIAPSALAIWIAAKNNHKEFTGEVKKVFGIRGQYFSDAYKFSQAVDKLYQGYKSGSESKIDKGYGKAGQLLGGKFHAPIPWRTVRDFQNIYRGMEGLKPLKVDYKADDFWDGVFTGEFIDFINLRKNKKSSSNW